MRTFEAESFRGAGDIAVGTVQFFQNVVAFLGLARLQQCGEFGAASCSADARSAVSALHEHGQVPGFEAWYRELGARPDTWRRSNFSVSLRCSEPGRNPGIEQPSASVMPQAWM